MLSELIAAAGPACVAVKPQLARFEALGAPGWAALEAVTEAARDAGLLVIADGKRGDVPVSAEAYADALFGSTHTPWGTFAGLGADAATLNPLMGEDSLEPLVDAAATAGAGIFVLVRTSNPGASDFLDLAGSGGPLHEQIARCVDRFAERLAGAGGFSGAGAVVGATEPRFLARLRELMPRAIFLLPGVGAPGRLRGQARGRVRRSRLGARDGVAQRRSARRSGRRSGGTAGPGLVDRRRLSRRP